MLQIINLPGMIATLGGFALNLRSLLLYICVYFFPMYSMKRCRGKDGLPDSSIPPPKRTAHWSKGLLQSMEDPNMILTSDGETVTSPDEQGNSNSAIQ